MVSVLVRGIGDVGSAVAHRLVMAGYAVVLQDGPDPTAIRRLNAFTDAVFDGHAELAGVRAQRVRDLAELDALLALPRCIPVVVGDLAPALAAVSPDVLVDARMRKRARPEVQRGLAPLTIGLGPGFVAGETVDTAIETSWDGLGAIITDGPTLPLAGDPRPILGLSRERLVYAPVAGRFRTSHAIGDAVAAGEVVALIDGTPLTAPVDGALRGLTRDGVPVVAGTKVIEVDPRGPAAVVGGITERPGRIADAVLRAVEGWKASATERADPPAIPLT